MNTTTTSTRSTRSTTTTTTTKKRRWNQYESNRDHEDHSNIANTVYRVATDLGTSFHPMIYHHTIKNHTLGHTVFETNPYVRNGEKICCVGNLHYHHGHHVFWVDWVLRDPTPLMKIWTAVGISETPKDGQRWDPPFPFQLQIPIRTSRSMTSQNRVSNHLEKTMKLGSNSLPRDVLPAVQTAPPVLWSSFGKLCRSPSTSHTSVTMAAPPVVISSPQGDDMGWDGRKLVICDRLRKHETWDKDVGCLEGKRETEGFTFSLPFSSIWLDLRNYLGSVTARCVVFQANLVFFHTFGVPTLWFPLFWQCGKSNFLHLRIS